MGLTPETDDTAILILNEIENQKSDLMRGEMAGKCEKKRKP